MHWFHFAPYASNSNILGTLVTSSAAPLTEVFALQKPQQVFAVTVLNAGLAQLLGWPSPGNGL